MPAWIKHSCEAAEMVQPHVMWGMLRMALAVGTLQSSGGWVEILLNGMALLPNMRWNGHPAVLYHCQFLHPCSNHWESVVTTAQIVVPLTCQSRMESSTVSDWIHKDIRYQSNKIKLYKQVKKRDPKWNQIKTKAVRVAGTPLQHYQQLLMEGHDQELDAKQPLRESQKHVRLLARSSPLH